MIDPTSWLGRPVLVIGHTGFKGAWLSPWLQARGAEVCGLSRGVPTSPSLYELLRVGPGMKAEHAGDVGDPVTVAAAVRAAAPRVA